jgi:hypothetical protein
MEQPLDSNWIHVSAAQPISLGNADFVKRRTNLRIDDLASSNYVLPADGTLFLSRLREKNPARRGFDVIRCYENTIPESIIFRIDLSLSD